MLTRAIIIIIVLSLVSVAATDPPASVCIVGSGIGGSSLAHFLRHHSAPDADFNIRIFERNGVVGGRMATVNVSGDVFEAGASILHPKNLYALQYTKLLNLTIREPSSSSSASPSLGIWDGHNFLFKTLGFDSHLPFVEKIVSLANSVLMFLRYGFSLLKMEGFVQVIDLFSVIIVIIIIIFLSDFIY